MLFTTTSVFSFIMDGCVIFDPILQVKNGTRVHYSMKDLVNGFFMVIPSAPSSYSAINIYDRCIRYRWFLRDYRLLKKKYGKRSFWPKVDLCLKDVLAVTKEQIMGDTFIETAVTVSGSVYLLRLVKEEGPDHEIKFTHVDTYLGNLKSIKLYADNDCMSSDSCIINMAFHRATGIEPFLEGLRRHGRFKTAEIMKRDDVLDAIRDRGNGADWIRSSYDSYIEERVLPVLVDIGLDDKTLLDMFPIFKSKKNATLRGTV